MLGLVPVAPKRSRRPQIKSASDRPPQVGGISGLCQGKPLRGSSGDCACGRGEPVDRPHRTVLRRIQMSTLHNRHLNVVRLEHLEAYNVHRCSLSLTCTASN